MSRIKLVLVMVIWGSLGVFTRSIPLSALSLAFLRALIALPVLFVVMMIKGDKPEKIAQTGPYILSGVLLGFGWLTLFCGFKHTGVTSAVLIYNMSPVYVLLAAGIFLKEQIRRIQIAVILLSFLGLFLIISPNLRDNVGYTGMLLSALSGMIYAAIIVINRGIRFRINNYTATFIQISAAMIVLLPFVLLDKNRTSVFLLDAKAICFTVLLGVLHTGLAYVLFFSVYGKMKSVEVVTFGYLEPLSAVLFSMLFLGEMPGIRILIGGLLILGSTCGGEVLKNRGFSFKNVLKRHDGTI